MFCVCVRVCVVGVLCVSGCVRVCGVYVVRVCLCEGVFFVCCMYVG